MTTTVLAETDEGPIELAVVLYTPLDVVRPTSLPCRVLSDALADLRDGAPVLRVGWMGITMERARCDLPYGEVPPAGTFWYAWVGLQYGWRGDCDLAERDVLDGEAWLKAWIRERCG